MASPQYIYSTGGPPSPFPLDRMRYVEHQTYTPHQHVMTQPQIPHNNYVHVPVFQTKKRVYVKRQYEGCCGAWNSHGWCDQDTGMPPCKFLNCGGCMDRERAYLVKPDGSPIKKKASWWCCGGADMSQTQW